jgi:hypothetical protein
MLMPFVSFLDAHAQLWAIGMPVVISSRRWLLSIIMYKTVSHNNTLAAFQTKMPLDKLFLLLAY